MHLKKFLISLLDSFLSANPWFILLFLDNPSGRKLFLKKYLRNRHSQFLKYYQWKPVWGKPKNILILKTDAIGDYLLFRNYLESISNHFRPKGYRIFLAGNLAWRELALHLDKEYVDGFFWLNRGGMNMKPTEENRVQFLSQINEMVFDLLLYPNFSREWEAGDWLLKHIPAKQKFGFRGNTINETALQQEIGNSYYSHLIEPENGVKFDFFRNGELISKFLQKEVSFKGPLISIEKKQNEFRKYAVLFPGASSESKKWPINRFFAIANLLRREAGFDVIFAGGAGDAPEIDLLCSQNSELFQNLAGKTTLVELIDLISSASLLISNDTAAAHIGAQTFVPTLCLFKGNHFGRFMPYPVEAYSNLWVCLHPELENLGYQECIRRFSDNDGLTINEISVNQVWKLILKIFDAEKT